MMLTSPALCVFCLRFAEMLNTSYLVVYAPIAFFASLLGVTLLSWAIRRTGKALQFHADAECRCADVFIVGCRGFMQCLQGGNRCCCCS